MNCPHCNKDIPDVEVARHLASKGGKKSKREITSEQQATMQRARRERASRLALAVAIHSDKEGLLNGGVDEQA